MQKLKELINNHAGIAIGVVILVLVVAGWSVLRNVGSRPHLGATTAFYSDDDGKTWFKDDAPLTTPFDHGGKAAYVAKVFRCNGKEFVGYLEKTGDKVVSRESAAPAPAPAGTGTGAGANGNAAAAAAMRSASGPGAGFVKKPGATEWIPRGNFRRAGMEMDVKCEGVAARDIVYVAP